MRERQKARLARHLRQASTDAETALWQRLRARQLGGWKFRRQAPVGPYVVDFLCIEARLVIELDGGQHRDRRVYDARRTARLEDAGLRVLRLWNHELLAGMDDALAGILDVLAQARPHPGPFPQAGEGEKRDASAGAFPCC